MVEFSGLGAKQATLGSAASFTAQGAFVISLAFELRWGVRGDQPVSSKYITNLHGAREAIPKILELFIEHDIADTRATGGFLFAESRDELESFHPALRPQYHDRRMDPYSEALGRGESDDPLHFAPGLVRLINSAPRQELGTHTYSHFYCLEAGAGAEAFRQDIASALAIGRAKGVEIRSIVLPRNQWNAEYATILREAGIECYRGTQPGCNRLATPQRTPAAPDRRRHAAEHALNYSPVPEPVHRVESANAAEARQLLRRLSPAVVIVNGTRILGRETLAATTAPFINMHAGITPAYRGVNGGYWALAERRPDLVGTTVHRVDEGIDTGTIIDQAFFSVTADDSFATYPYLHTAAGLRLLVNAVVGALDRHILYRSPDPALNSTLRHHPASGHMWRIVSSSASGKSSS